MHESTSLVDFIKFAEYEEDVAVIFDNGVMKESLTYKRLKELSDQISDELSKYITKSCVVGICMETQLNTPTFIIGILKNGSTFYNFDSDCLQFIQHVLMRVGCRVILTDKTHLKLLQSLIIELDGDVIPLKLMEESFYLISLKAVSCQSHTYQLAYVITTSGTTGVPKIVMVPHACIAPNIVHIRKIYNLSSDDIVFLCSPLTFDPSIVEIFTTFSVGAKLLIVPAVVKMMPDYLLDIICQRNNVTVMQATPTLFSRFGPMKLKNSFLGDNSSIRVISLGGEKFPDVSVLNSYRSSNNQTTFINLYGVTEVSAWATYYVLTEEDFRLEKSIPLGTCLQETVMEVRDESGHKITEGKGQLFIGGYKRQCMILTSNQDDDTYDDNMLKLHPTGDIVRLDNKGNLFYLGRKDNQLKLHGKRINLDEITQVSLKHEEVTDSTTLMIGTRIVTFVTLSHRHGLESIRAEIKTYMAKRLPSYSVPDDMVIVEYMPITKHGKVDKCRLNEIYEVCMKTDELIIYTAQLLKKRWKAKLNIEENIIQEESNFVQLGGNSLTAIHLLNDLEKYLGVQLPCLLDKLLNQMFKDCDEYIHYVSSMKNSTPVIHKRIMNKRKIPDISVDNQSTFAREILHPSRSFRYTVSRSNECQICKLTGEEVNSQLKYFKKNLNHKQKKMNSETSTRCIPDNNGSGSVNDKNVKFEYKCISDDHSDMVDSNIKETPSASCFKGVLQLEEEWRFNTGKCVDASPLIALEGTKGDVIFIGSHSHKFYAIDLTSGECIWETTLEDRIEATACLSLCGNFVIVGCYDGYIYSLDCTSGNLWWKYQTGSQVKCCPIIDKNTGLVYAGSHSQSVYCLNIERRELVWSNNLMSGSIFASPVMDYEHGTVLVATLGGKVLSLNKVNGMLMWSFDCKKPVFSSLKCNQNGVLVGCTDMCLYHLDFDGNLLWKFPTTGPIFSSPSLFLHSTRNIVNEIESYIFIGSHDCTLYCLSMHGSLIWKTKVAAQVYSTPFCCDMIVYKDNVEFVIENNLEDDPLCCDMIVYKDNVEFVIENNMEDDSNNEIIKSNEKTLANNDRISQTCEFGKEKIKCLRSNNSYIDTFPNALNEITNPIKSEFSRHTGKIENPLITGTSTDISSEHLTIGPRDDVNDLKVGSKFDSPNDYMTEKEITLPNMVTPVVVFCSTDGTLYIMDVKDGHILCEKTLSGEVFSSPVCYKDSIVIGCRDDYVYNFKLRIKDM